MVKSLTEQPELPTTAATLTEDGNKAFISAAKAALKGCLAKKETNPTGCPNQIFPTADQVITPGSIRWSTHNDTWGNFKGGLVESGSSGYLAKGKLGLKFLFAATGSAGGQPQTYNNNAWSNQWRYFFITADLTKEPMKIVWDRAD